MSNNKDSELKEIIEGFNLFGSETDGLINPTEVKEIMDIMNMGEKNPFLYNIINNLCSDEEIQQKGGINAEDFISLLDQELDDISSIEGLQKIFSIFSDANSNKISLPIFSQIINQNNNLDLGKDEKDIKKLISKPDINGKEIDFNEFKDIMNTGKEKTNLIYMKKSSHNSNKKKNKINENNNINNSNYNDQDSKQNSEINIDINNNKKNIINPNSNNEVENNYDSKEIEKDEINNKNIIEFNYDNDVTNFDNVNPEYKLNNTKEENNKSKKKYRHMHESPKNKKENEFQKDQEELSNQEEKINNNISYENKNNDNFNEEINFNTEDNSNNKEDKTEKRYHRRYRDIKSPPQKQKEENPKNENNIEENTDNKISSKYWRYRRKK